MNRRVILTSMAGLFTLVMSFFGTLWLITPAYEAALPTVSPGQTLSFANGMNKGALIDGWSSNPEAWGFWSDDKTARLGVFVSGQANKLTVSGGPFITPQMPTQTVEVWSGRTRLKTFQLSAAQATLEIPLNGVSVSPLVLTFTFPNVKSPKELGVSADTRKLGLGVFSIRFDS